MRKRKELKRALRNWRNLEEGVDAAPLASLAQGEDAAVESLVEVILETLSDPDSTMLEAADNAALGLRLDTQTERRVALSVIWQVMIRAALVDRH